MDAGVVLKFAVTVVPADNVTEQEPVPEQPPPLQPVKVEPAADAAVRLTTPEKLPEHEVPQVIPAGALVTVPLPVPVLTTASDKDAAAVVLHAWFEYAEFPAAALKARTR